MCEATPQATALFGEGEALHFLLGNEGENLSKDLIYNINHILSFTKQLFSRDGIVSESRPHLTA